MSPPLFNVVVENVIWTWLAMKVEDQKLAHNGLVAAVGLCMGFFYTNDDMIGSRDPDCLKHFTNVMIGLFQHYGLAATITKSLSMTFQTSALRSGMSAEAEDLKCMGMEDSYRIRLIQRIPCLECGVELTAGKMMAHRCHMHRTEPEIDWNWLTVSQTEHHPQVYNVRFPQPTKRCP